MTPQRSDTRLGILLMAATCVVFAAQDGLSRHLAGTYNVWVVVTLRYWFLVAFVLLLARARGERLRDAARTAQPALQVARGLLLAAEICVMVLAFTLLGLARSHAVFACYPLVVAALSGPILGERVGWRRWAAIAAGFVGVVVILDPGAGTLDPRALVPLLSATMFALYGLLTRRAARTDSSASSFLWTGLVGAVAMTPLGLARWEWMTPPDAALMAVLCVSGALGHWLLIKTYEVAEASAVQPFAYLQLVFATALGIAVFGETVGPNVVAGAGIVAGAGLFALWRERLARRRGRGTES